MLTLKKLNNDLKDIIEQIERKEELDMLLQKIKNYFNKNPNNCFSLNFTDLTKQEAIINVNNIKNCEAK